MPVAGQKQQAGEQLDHQIAGRDFGFAMAAAAAQDEPAQHRKIVVESDRLLALGACRTRRHYRESSRQAVDTHVQKAAKGQPKEKNRRCEDRIHGCFLMISQGRNPTVRSEPLRKNAKNPCSWMDYKAIKGGRLRY